MNRSHLSENILCKNGAEIKIKDRRNEDGCGEEGRKRASHVGQTDTKNTA